MKPLHAVQLELGKIANGYQQQITSEVPAEIRPPQLDVMTQINQLPRPVMGTTAGLYTNQATWVIGKKDQHLLAF